MEEQAVERRIHQKYIDDCNRAAAEQNQKRLNAMKVAQDNMNMAANRQRQQMAYNVRDKLNEDDLLKQKKTTLQNFIRWAGWLESLSYQISAMKYMAVSSESMAKREFAEIFWLLELNFLEIQLMGITFGHYKRT